MAIKPWRDISLGKKRAFTRWKCVVLQCTVGITSQLQYKGMFHWNSILRRQFMFEHLAASKTVTARPNEQLIQNAINWPQEVKTAFPKWKKSVLNNISQAWTPKKRQRGQDAHQCEEILLTDLCCKQSTALPWSLVSASMPPKNDSKRWSFCKWPICWPWKVNFQLTVVL